MKNIKLLTISIIAVSALNSCVNNTSLSNNLNATGDSIVRFVNGTFTAEIENTSVKSVYNATELALNNSNIYNIKSNALNNQTAEINGNYPTDKNFFNKEGQDNFSIRIIKNNANIINIFIKIGKLGDKQASIELLANIRNNLGL